MNSYSVPNYAFVSPLAMSHQRSTAYAEVVKGVLLSAAYFAMARTGLFTRFDGPLFAIVGSLVLPRWRPCFLLMVLSVQDAPGQVIQFDYVGVAGISGLMILTAALRHNGGALSAETTSLRSLMFFALAIVVFGTFNSAVQHRFGFHEQSSTRPFAVIGRLIAMMIVTGYLAHREISNEPLSSVRVQTVAICILVHIFLIAGLQVFLGPLFGASPQGADEIRELDQMMNGGARGMARLTGPFLSPNLLASVPGLLMLIILRYQKATSISAPFIVAFFTIGLSAALLGGARTMFVFYLAGTAAMTWTRSPKHTLLAGCLAAPCVLALDIPWSEVMVMMRLKDLHSLGVRGELWQATLHYMDLNDWLFGCGLTHFPVFCQTNLGYYGSDPHNWILSAAQMFGLLGLIFYGLLIRTLVRKSFSIENKQRAIAICLLLFFIGREFANTQYVLNNNPLCCLYWIMISLVFSAPRQSVQAADADTDTDQSMLSAGGL